jgi:hypothetical protein
LHITQSSDIPPSPPVHTDQPPLPGQLLASSKLLPCCAQYLQRQQRTVPSLSFPCWRFFPSSPLVGGAPPTIVPPTITPTTGSTNVPGGCCIVGGSNYRHHCCFGGRGSRLYSKSCIYLVEPCLTRCCFGQSITNSLILLPLTVMGAQVDSQLGKDVDSINLFCTTQLPFAQN